MLLQYTHIGRAIGLSAITIFLLLLSRAIFSFPVLSLHNYFATEKVNWREIVIAWCVSSGAGCKPWEILS